MMRQPICVRYYLASPRSDRITHSKKAFKISGLCGLHAVQNEQLCHLLPICTVAAAWFSQHYQAMSDKPAQHQGLLHARVLGAVTAANRKLALPNCRITVLSGSQKPSDSYTASLNAIGTILRSRKYCKIAGESSERLVYDIRSAWGLVSVQE